LVAFTADDPPITFPRRTGRTPCSTIANVGAFVDAGM
jgi:hypothetical protein